jgi:hypothetical protein
VDPMEAKEKMKIVSLPGIERREVLYIKGM